MHLNDSWLVRGCSLNKMSMFKNKCTPRDRLSWVTYICLLLNNWWNYIFNECYNIKTPIHMLGCDKFLSANLHLFMMFVINKKTFHDHFVIVSVNSFFLFINCSKCVNLFGAKRYTTTKPNSCSSSFRIYKFKLANHLVIPFKKQVN